MYKDIEKQLLSLQEPTVFNIKTFDELLAENIELAKEILGSDWLPLESDPYMKKLRVLTLRQMHNQADKKETVKQLLVTTATGKDLDNLGASVGIFRDSGEYPYTNFEFKLLAQSDDDVVIPKGLILNDLEDKHRAFVVEDVVITTGAERGIAKVELLEFVEQSDVKCENIVTELTFGVEVKQLGIFDNGASFESDDRYRFRIIASNNRYSVAGPTEAYKYFVYEADARIDDVSIPDDNEVLHVDIYIASFSGVDDVMIQRANVACNDKYTRPIGDKVSVLPAEIIALDIDVKIELFDLLKQSDVEKRIRENFLNSFFIGQNFVRSDLIRKCHIDGVYRVSSDFEDVLVSNKQIIKIESLNLEFVEADI